MTYTNKILSVKVTSDLSVEPVSVAEVKAYGNITYTDYDTLIASFIKVARKLCEQACGRSFGSKDVEVVFTHNGCNRIRMPLGPLDGGFDTIEYRFGPLGTYTDVSANTDWELDGDFFTGAQGQYRVSYSPSDELFTDESVKTAIKAQAVDLLENRADESKQGKLCDQARVLIYSLMPGDMML